MNRDRITGTHSEPIPGDAKKRRAKWLELDEAGMSAPDILDWESALTLEQRFALGGKKAGKRLRVERGYRRGSLEIIRKGIVRARWERELNGKPPSYGRALWAFMRKQEGFSPKEILDRWNRLCLRVRQRYSPQVYEEFQDAKQVRGAIVLAGRHGAQEATGRLLSVRGERKKGRGLPSPLDVLLCRWHYDEKLTYYQCRDRWNEMSKEDQEAQAPGCSGPLPGGEPGATEVFRRVYHAALSLGKRAIRTERKKWERDHLFLKWERDGSKGALPKRMRFESLPQEDQQRLWPEFSRLRKRGLLSSVNATIRAATRRATEEENWLREHVSDVGDMPEQQTGRAFPEQEPTPPRQPPTDPEAPNGYVGPYAPAQLRKIFHCSQSTLARRLNGKHDRPIRNKKRHEKSFLIHPDDLPEGARRG
jgi:hypothetical protein